MDNKIAAVLGNGPSRKSYDPSKEYDYRIGCNVPWTDVDCTVIIDTEIVRLWKLDPDLIKCPAYFSGRAWEYAGDTHVRGIIYGRDAFKGIVDKQDNDSSANMAARILIRDGYKNIDIYGCDAYFTEQHGYNTKSFTRTILPTMPALNNSYKWKLSWDDMVKKHPDVNFNFIR
jgi:hypothetical protein